MGKLRALENGFGGKGNGVIDPGFPNIR